MKYVLAVFLYLTFSVGAFAAMPIIRETPANSETGSFLLCDSSLVNSSSPESFMRKQPQGKLNSLLRKSELGNWLFQGAFLGLIAFIVGFTFYSFAIGSYGIWLALALLIFWMPVFGFCAIAFGFDAQKYFRHKKNKNRGLKCALMILCLLGFVASIVGGLTILF